MAKTNSKVDTENEKSYLTIEEFNAIRKMDFPNGENVRLLVIRIRYSSRTMNIKAILRVLISILLLGIKGWQRVDMVLRCFPLPILI